jgi:hypothetical protein
MYPYPSYTTTTSTPINNKQNTSPHTGQTFFSKAAEMDGLIRADDASTSVRAVAGRAGGVQKKDVAPTAG